MFSLLIRPGIEFASWVILEDLYGFQLLNSALNPAIMGFFWHVPLLQSLASSSSSCYYYTSSRQGRKLFNILQIAWTYPMGIRTIGPGGFSLRLHRTISATISLFSRIWRTDRLYKRKRRDVVNHRFHCYNIQVTFIQTILLWLTNMETSYSVHFKELQITHVI